MKRAIALTLLCTATSYAGPHDFIAEHAGAGATAQNAQPYIDQLLRQVEKMAGWPANSAKGAWVDDEKGAETAIADLKPGFAILDPEVYLALRKKHGLEPIASVKGATFNKGHYSIVTKNAAIKTLADLKGKKVSSNHFASPRYINKVAFDGKVDIEKDWVLEKAIAPSKPLRAVINGSADAALIDDEQLAKMKDLEGGDQLKVVWTSSALPPTPVVAFEKVVTTPADRKKMSEVLQKVCSDTKGKQICDSMFIDTFGPVDKAAFSEAAKKYDAPASTAAK
jgi:ABC-type phosphate/phosphonate transport system substrate-binding protein